MTTEHESAWEERMMRAACEGDEKALAESLAHGARPYHFSNFGCEHFQYASQPLEVAARLGRVGCVKLLVESGASPWETDERGSCAAVSAGLNGRAACLREMASAMMREKPEEFRGHEYRAAGERLDKLLFKIVSGKKPGVEDCAAMIIAMGADPNVECVSMFGRLRKKSGEAHLPPGMGPLAMACGEGRIETVAALVQAGADLWPVGAMPPLGMAFSHGRMDAMSALAMHGVFEGDGLARGEALIGAMSEEPWSQGVEHGVLDFAKALLERHGMDRTVDSGRKAVHKTRL